jgi:hypothetical protein
MSTFARHRPASTTLNCPKELRSAPRRRVLRAGKVAYGQGFSADCPIRDESATGARIAVGGHPLPRQVILMCVSTGVAYEAQVMWRRDDEAGLRLGRRHQLERGPARAADSLRLAQRLWRHNRAL